MSIFFFILISLSVSLFSASIEKSNDQLNATLWQQTAVERKAVNFSIYAGAQRLLDEAINDHHWTAALEQDKHYESKPPAIILDIDETVLDTSAYAAWQVKTDSSYTNKSWFEFTSDVVCTPIPGALDFTKAAVKKGVAVFYVSNRKAPEEAATIKNLKKFGFPSVDKKHVVLRNEKPEWNSAKGKRRAWIAKKYRIIMLFGDNFGDFTDRIQGGITARDKAMKKYTRYWGTRWFMLPNPMYGSWESAAFDEHWKKIAPSTPTERRLDKLDSLKSWSGP